MVDGLFGEVDGGLGFAAAPARSVAPTIRCEDIQQWR
jgi:hypothetical protein